MMKEHIEAIQKYMKEKYGVEGNINIYFHKVEDGEQAQSIVSDVAKDLEMEYRHEKSECGDTQWYETKGTLKIHVAAFYEKGEENEHHQRVV